MNLFIAHELGHFVDDITMARTSKRVAAYGATLVRTAAGAGTAVAATRYGLPVASFGLCLAWTAQKSLSFAAHRKSTEGFMYRHGRAEHFARRFEETHGHYPFVRIGNIAALHDPAILQEQADMTTAYRAPNLATHLGRCVLDTLHELTEVWESGLDKFDYLRLRLGLPVSADPAPDAILKMILNGQEF
jgi:hypothetical protein